MTRWSRRPSTDEQLNSNCRFPPFQRSYFPWIQVMDCASPKIAEARCIKSIVCNLLHKFVITFSDWSLIASPVFFCSFTEQTFSAFTIKIGYVWQVTINKNTWSWPKLLAIKMHKLLEPFFLYLCDFVWNKLLFGFKFITDLSDYLTWVFFYRGIKKIIPKAPLGFY